MIAPYYNDLVRIRKALEIAEFGKHCPNFPKNGCDTAMTAVKSILGLEVIRGEYTPLRKPHNWNHDKDLGIFVDLALDQFDGVDQDIVILPDTTELLVVDHEKTQHLPNAFNSYEHILVPFYRAYRALRT